MSVLAKLSVLHRRVVIWTLETWLQDLTDAGFEVTHDSSGANHRMAVVAAADSMIRSTKLMFKAVFCSIPSEVINTSDRYDYFDWAYIGDSPNITFRPRVANVISWFCGGICSGCYMMYGEIVVRAADETMIAGRKEQLYVDLRRLLLVKEIIQHPDCSSLVYNLLGQLAWDS